MPPVTLDRELTEAIDLLRHRLDRDLVDRLDNGDFAANLLEYLRNRDTPRLPFTADHLPRIMQLAQQHDPDEHAWEKRIAEEAIAGRAYGASNPYAEKFLELPDDFDFNHIESDDPETIHGLCRHRWFKSLACHYWDEQDLRYFDALLRHWDWFWGNVPPINEDIVGGYHGIGGNRTGSQPEPYHTLDTHIRLREWWWAFWISLHAAPMTAERCATLLARSLRTFDVVAARGVHTQEHNFTTMQMESLYFWATALPEATGMTVWRHAARGNLEASLRRAILPDGMQWEQSISYHRGCIGWYGRPMLLGALNGDTWAEEYRDRLRQMGTLLDAVITPDGNVPLLSDSDRTRGWRGGMALMHLIDPDMQYTHSVGPSYETLLMSDGQTWQPGKPAQIEPVRVFPDAGLAVTRHPNLNAGHMLIFDNGPCRAGHAHKDNLTLHYEALGNPVLVDPGRWIYRSGADRAWVLQPLSHNTLWIEDTPMGPEDEEHHERFQRIECTADPRVSPIETEQLTDPMRMVRMTTRFAGHTDDPHAQVWRTVWFPLDDGAPWLAVLDRIDAPTEHTWTNSWLLPADEALSETDGTYAVTLSHGLQLRIAAAASEPLQCRDDAKFWCPNYGQKSPARWVRFTSRCAIGWRACLFAPGGESPPTPRIDAAGDTLRFHIGARTVEVPR